MVLHKLTNKLETALVELTVLKIIMVICKKLKQKQNQSNVFRRVLARKMAILTVITAYTATLLCIASSATKTMLVLEVALKRLKQSINHFMILLIELQT